MQQVREDFDRIASLMARERELPETYADYLLSHVPHGCGEALDIGCGLGAFARRVAGRAARVTAIDLSAEMIAVARKRSANFPNLEFALCDFLQAPLPLESYDLIITLATLHHLPLKEALGRIKSLLRPGGVLILHDLLAASGPFDRAFDLVRLPVSMLVRLRNGGRLIPRAEVRRAWQEHGKHESYLTPREVLAMRDEHFPGGRVHRHFLWRYTVIWQKPDAAS
ncbi:MAG TPA: class I SAM-dependent methyltransferase [Pyrinomonadaceae bacterium]|nr:class I SAM-dependent methyltransferase [Pyrinomonadaceae bacterium]